ncbi:MAG: IS21-like element helper ATPase IstB [Verrucomicrobia bacterium]|nr:IS21-like element helper ATPase IstB [Verrucomicrobiota bacterium]
MSIQPELKTVLKRLKLSGMLATLPDRVAYARKEKLDYTQFLELVLSDEVERRDQKHVTNRLTAAGFEEECTLERFDWSANIRIDKARLMDLFGLHFIERNENVVFCGPVGVGKSFLAQSLGHAACRANYRVLFVKADLLLKTLARSRADNSFDRELRAFISPDLLIVDDFALRKLSSQATSDFYDLLIERHTRSSTILTSNRSVEEWMSVFDEPMLGQSALDRFCHRAHQFVIDGESYRKRMAPASSSSPPPQPSTLKPRRRSNTSHPEIAGRG